jgi:hypothetical protein
MASQNATKVHAQLSALTVLFFEKHLQNADRFKSYLDDLLLAGAISTTPWENDYRSAKKVIQGKIMDAKTGLPLAFVNIGVLKKEIGTVSNEQGKYEIQIDPELESDTLRVSSVGYKAKLIPVKEMLLRTSNDIRLEEEIQQLTEVVVTSRQLKKKNVGNKTTSKFVSTGFGYDQLGAEIGIKINVSRQPTFVDAFHFHISYNRLSAKILFRLNIYEIEKGRPSKNILTENIIIPVAIKETGLMTVDLTHYNIILKEDVIATLEWVKNEGENKKGEGIFFSLGVFNSGTFIKRASQGKLKKHSNMGVGMNFDVRQ